MNTLESLDKDAIATRCKVIELKKGYKQSEKFPVNANQVADWLYRKYLEYIKESEVFEEVVDNCNTYPVEE